MSKTTPERVQECIRLRTQWTEHFSTEFPDLLKNKMNDFVSETSTPSSGLFLILDPRDQREKKLHYQFSTQKGRKTFLRIGSAWI